MYKGQGHVLPDSPVTLVPSVIQPPIPVPDEQRSRPPRKRPRDVLSVGHPPPPGNAESAGDPSVSTIAAPTGHVLPDCTISYLHPCVADATRKITESVGQD